MGNSVFIYKRELKKRTNKISDLLEEGKLKCGCSGGDPLHKGWEHGRLMLVLYYSAIVKFSEKRASGEVYN